MFTVALVGADGAGKSTLGRRLERMLPAPAKYVYMGVNLEASNLVLPTTRLWIRVRRALGWETGAAGPPALRRTVPYTRSPVKRAARGLKSTLRLLNLVTEEWFRQGVIWYYGARGYIVVLDRHFFLDFYAHDIANDGAPRPLSRRLHVYILRRFYPRPTLVICLDAPPDVLHARKPEGTLEALESRRQAYLRLADVVEHFAVVDAAQPEDRVTRQVADLIRDSYRRYRAEDGSSVQPPRRDT